ncbi:acyltransferase family protein [Pedobacter yulinensis]|nr:acyltransferase family protein [Pedobacter yulinensis]
MTNVPLRDHWIDHLRAFVTILVVLHHAAMAYACFAQFNPDLYIASTHPVVDSARWRAFDFFVAANDTFFMPLMFLLSGLFFHSARLRRGTRGLLKERFRRLAIPFLFAEFS